MYTRFYFRAWPVPKRVAKVLPHTIIVMYTATAAILLVRCITIIVVVRPPARWKKIKINFTVIKNSVGTFHVLFILTYNVGTYYTGLLHTMENHVSLYSSTIISRA